MLASWWEPLTAVGTLVLAAVTFGLAVSTRKLARAAGAETRANWQPVLVVDAAANAKEGSGGLALVDARLSVDVVNVGRGPALLVRANLHNEAPPEGGYGERGQGEFPGRGPRDVVAPGEHITIRWPNLDIPSPSPSPGLGFWSRMDGRITYCDVAYVRYETEFKLDFRVDGFVAMLDQRFLGAALERIGRVDRLRYRALLWRLAAEARLARRLARRSAASRR